MESTGTRSLPDKWLFFILYPLLALMVVHVGNDNSFSHLLTLPSYYTDLLLAFAIAYSLGLYFHWLYRKLTLTVVKLSYHFYLRIFWAGLIAPVGFSLVVELIYLHQIGIALKDSSVFYLELPLVVMSCLLINLIYILLILSRHRNQNIQKEQKDSEDYPLKENDYSACFSARLGNKMVRIGVDDVAYFMIRDRITFLVASDGRRYFYDDSLENVVPYVNPDSFYQLNRQFLAKRQSILSATQTKTRRLIIQLAPDPEQPVYVAKNKASQFLSWLRRE
jgi:hypothetical protein